MARKQRDGYITSGKQRMQRILKQGETLAMMIEAGIEICESDITDLPNRIVYVKSSRIVIYFGFLIYGGRFVSSMLQKGDSYSFSRPEEGYEVNKCSFFYKDMPVSCTWKEKKNKKGNVRYELTGVSGDNIGRKNKSAVKLYISEWAFDKQAKSKTK